MFSVELRVSFSRPLAGLNFEKAGNKLKVTHAHIKFNCLLNDYAL